VTTQNQTNVYYSPE